MQWRPKVRSDGNNHQQYSYKQATSKTQTSSNSWSDKMISTHLPIYPIHYDNDNGCRISKILFDSISPSVSCVLLGESTHGTHEFFTLRSFITKYLILYKGFTSIFIELDWPKVYRLNEYVLDTLDNNNNNITIDQIFDDIKCYPHWMGRNKIIKQLIIWLKNYNLTLKQNNKESEMISFYGIDMQCYDSLNSLKQIYEQHKSLLPHAMQIISFLNGINVKFSHWSERHYIDNQINIVYELFSNSKYKLFPQNRNNRKMTDLIHNIDQNFMTLKAAINYFDNDCLWDIRDMHWFNTIEKYFYYKSNGKYLGFDQPKHNQKSNKGKVILWAHNSHICNAQYTNYSHSNIGAILKTKYGQDNVFTISFDSFAGTVTATHERNELAQFFIMHENVNESFGSLFNKLSNRWMQNYLMIFLQNGIDKMQQMKIEIKPKHFVSIEDIKKKKKIRDIGVCYVHSNPYYHCSNANILQIADVVIFVNESHALEPFECDKHKNWDKHRKIWLSQNNNNNNNKQIN